MSADAGQIVAAIIAGGEGKRLGGVDKSALLVGGRSIAERQLEVLRPLFPRVLAISGRPEPWRALGVDVVADRVGSGRGPLAGIDAALAALLPGEAAIVCVGCDMPFLSPAALRLLRDTAGSGDAVVPEVRGHAEPLFARYRRSCAAPIADALARGAFKTSALLATLAVHWVSEGELRAVDPDLATLLNVNTPEELAAAERRVASEA
jgi:molybdenum cofactor guanylyltransferase